MQNLLHRRNRIWLQRSSWMHLSGRRWNRLSACGRKRKINSPETGAILKQVFCRQAESFPNDVLPVLCRRYANAEVTETTGAICRTRCTAGTVFGYSGAAGCICPADGGTDCQRVVEKGKSIVLKQEQF